MKVLTSKDAAVVQALLASLTNTAHQLRSVKSLAQEAGISESDVVRYADALGLARKTRHRDGATLFGIAGIVNGRDVVHTPTHGGRRYENSAAPTQCDVAFEKAKMVIKDALNNRKWTARSHARLKELAACDDSMLSRVLSALGAVSNRDYARLRCR